MHSSFFEKKSKPIVYAVSVLSVLTAGLVAAGVISGSDSKGLAHESAYERYDSGFVVAQPGSYDSADTAVIKDIDTQNSTVTFMNIETGRYYTLNYNGTTLIQDKYGSGMSMAQMQDGDIVDVTFLRNKKVLASMKLSESAWVIEDTEKYNFDTFSKNAEIGGGVYSLRDNLVISSEGRDAQLEDIVRGDVVSISGVGNSVYSVVVEEGHGYLRLSNDEYLKGGWIEVGQSVIQQISEDMLLVVPEGTYDVHLTASGIDVTKQVTIYRNQELTLDVSDVKPEAPKMGKLIFAINPSDAQVFLDGEEIDIQEPAEVEYGIHKMEIKADGYESVTQYIKVGQQMASISVTLEEAEEDTDADNLKGTSAAESDADDKKGISASEADGTYKVYISSPSGVEVYQNGVYLGMAPVSFAKQEGTYTITLRKTGYVTKSYTIQIDDTPKDVTYSFSALEKEPTPTKIKDSTVSSNVPQKKSSTTGEQYTVSGNETVSGNYGN